MAEEVLDEHPASPAPLLSLPHPVHTASLPSPHWLWQAAFVPHGDSAPSFLHLLWRSSRERVSTVTTDRADEFRAGGANSLVQGELRIPLVLTTPFRGGKHMIPSDTRTSSGCNPRHYDQTIHPQSGHCGTWHSPSCPLGIMLHRACGSAPSALWCCVVRSLIELPTHPLAAAVSYCLFLFHQTRSPGWWWVRFM